MTEEKASRRVEICAGLFMFALGIAGFLAVPSMVSSWAFAMPGLTSSSLSPSFFPRAAMLAVALTGLAVAATTRERNDVIPIVSMGSEEWRRAIVTGLAVIFYGLSVPLIGFVPGSCLFILGMAVSAGYWRWAVILPVSLLFPIVTMLVFRWGLKVLLPGGMIL